jgi:hypothetical protein
MAKHFSLLFYKKEINFDTPLQQNPFKALLIENFVGTPSAVVIRRGVLQKAGGFNAAHGYCDDYSYWFRCAVQTDFLLISDVLFYKRTHAANISNDIIKMVNGHKIILEDLAVSQTAYLKTHQLEKVRRAALVTISYEYGNAYFETGRPWLAFAQYLEALKYHVSFSNFFRFFWMSMKKFGRLVTFNAVSRTRLFGTKKSHC